MKQTLKYILDKLIDLIKISEQKYSITLAIASGVIVLGSSFIGNISVYVKILACGTVVLSLISMVYGFMALFAKKIHIRTHSKKQNFDNLIFYKNIIKFDEESYVHELKKRYNFPSSYKPDELDLDLARTVISQAKIVNNKLTFFNLSLTFLLLSVFSAVAMVMFLGGI